MPANTTGVDVGLRSGVFLRGHAKGNTFVVLDYAFNELEAANVAEAWSQVDPGFAPKAARVGVTGREVNLRYSRVPRLPDWQLRKLMRFEVEEVGGSSESEVAADFNLLPELPELDGEDVVLLAMAKEELLEQHLEGLEAVKGALSAFSPATIGLYNAWLRFGVVLDDTVMLANIGHESVDVIIVRGTDLVFARNLSGGSKTFDDAIAERLNCTPQKASQVKRKLVDVGPGARYVDAAAEKASRACAGPAGQMASLLQSTLAFAKGQVRLPSLRLDRVFICGGGAKLRGLDRYLTGAVSAPVEVFDPFKVVDTSKLASEDLQELERHAVESVVALGLATGGSDPEAYAIEILPGSIAKRREFVQGKLFLILAALIGVAYLGFSYFTTSRELDDLSGSLARMNGEVRRLERVDVEARELLERNAELAEEAEELFELAAQGEQLAAALEALDVELPPGFWLTSLVGSQAKDEFLSGDSKDELPVLQVQGRAQEGIEPNELVFQRFVSRLREQLPDYTIAEQMAPDGGSFSLRLTLASAPAQAVDPELDDEAEDA
jgi:type IV pilus assembly protein PilM